MPPTTKITVEQEGEPSVTLHIDQAEPPVSLGDLLKRAKAAREMPSREFTSYSFTPKVGQNTHPVSFEVMGGGHIIRAIDSDLEDVLDSYRLAGKLCGLQVFAVDQVICWAGDIEAAAPNLRLSLRYASVPPPPLFHEARGANALEDAAKWLREQLDPAPAKMSYDVTYTDGYSKEPLVIVPAPRDD